MSKQNVLPNQIKYPIVPGLLHRLTVRLWGIPTVDICRGVLCDRMDDQCGVSWDVAPGTGIPPRSRSHDLEWIREEVLLSDTDFQQVEHNMTLIWKIVD